jgi:hypothetical protein
MQSLLNLQQTIHEVENLFGQTNDIATIKWMASHRQRVHQIIAKK